MKLNAIRVILVETSHPGNIGAAARAMKTMGLSRLYLVSPKLFPDKNAVEMASGAQDVLENAVCVDSLDEALLGAQLILMTSARPRDIALPGLTPDTAAKTMTKMPEDTEIALVFGRERIGLTNEELLHGHYHVEIPTNPVYSSLNLAQAVQIIAYEVAKAAATGVAVVPKPEDELAKAEQVEQYYEHLEKVLEKIDFLKPSNPKQVMLRLRRLFNRAKLEAVEVNILRGILTQIIRTIGENNG
ncbi:MAG: RNA methyltransferase [Gammaproteobacteria bacterium]|nr:RNA methyltransferase [Gammaproteobacteria bacterium]